MDNLNTMPQPYGQLDFSAHEQKLLGFFEKYSDQAIYEKLWTFYKTRALHASNLAHDPAAELLFFDDLLQVLQHAKSIGQQLQQRQQFIESAFEEHTLMSLEGLVNLIKEAMPVAFIYNLSPTQKNLDLMIVLDKTCTKPCEEFESLIDLVTLGYSNGSCTIHPYSSLHHQLRKGHIFYHTACVTANLVYHKTNEEPFPLIDPKLFEKTKLQAETVFNSGMEKAVHFYCGAQNYINSGIYDMAMFMLQQACELTYRCLLNVLRGKDVKCHAPAILRKHVRRFAPEVIGVFSDQEEKELDYLGILEDAYIKSRYQQQYLIDEQLVKFLNECVGNLQQKSFELFEQKLAVLTNLIIKQKLGAVSY